jgi:hypothetical protein
MTAMVRLCSHGLVFTEFLDPAGERWVEVLREVDRSIRSYRQMDNDSDLDEFVERWIRYRLGADPAPAERCAACQCDVWIEGRHPPGRTGDEAVEIDATVERAGVIRFVGTILCCDCAEGILTENEWISRLIGEDP